MNRFVPVVGGHLIAAGVGFLSDEFVPSGTWAPAVAITVAALAVVVALAAVYLLLRHVIAPRRWAHLFGLDEHPNP